MKFAPILSYPFILILLFLSYQLFYLEDETNSIWLIPCVIILTAIFVFNNQLNNWWMKRKQPDPDIGIVNMLDAKVMPYRRLDIERKRDLSRKLNVFVHNAEFIGMGLKNIPDDIQFITCVYGFFLGKDEQYKWFKNYNRFAYYKHPFLSPDLPETIHTSEHHKEDGIFVFSLEQLMPAIEDPEKYYNIVLHEFACAYLSTVNSKIQKSQYDAIWRRLEELGICSKQSIESIIGLKQDSPAPILLHYYIQFPEIMRVHFKDYMKFFDAHTSLAV